MQAKDLMSRKPRAVRSIDRLDAAARIMWENDCGFCPVVDPDGVVVGVLTDRDLCMAAYTQGRPLAELPVTAAMARHVRACRAEDPLGAVLQAMEQTQVHRLPVVDARGQLAGVISTNDLLRGAIQRPAAVDQGAVLRVLAAIGAPRRAEAAESHAPAAAVAVATGVAAAGPGVTEHTVLAKPGASPTAAAPSEAPKPAPQPKAASKPKPRTKGKR